MTNATSKVTKRDKFGMVRAIIKESSAVNKDELLEFIDKEITQLTKKNSSTSKTAKENVEVKENIANTMREMNRPVKCGELVTTLGLSQSKVSAMLTQMKTDGVVIRTQDKKDVYFTLA